MGESSRPSATATDRRGLLLGGAALAVGGCTTPGVLAPVVGDGLDRVAQGRGFRFGSCVNAAPAGVDAASVANPSYTALLARDCGVLVAENEMKWQATRPAPDRFDFRRFDRIAAYARQTGQRLRGHTLLWHYDRWFPRWLNDHDYGANPRMEAERLLATHIRTVCARYAGQIVSYDVVNEAVEPETSNLRQTSLSRAMGSAEAVLDHAFRTAREAAPGVELVYNDYMSWEDGNDRHRAGVLRLLEGFRARGTPVDALGVQSHIGLFDDRPVAEQVRRFTPEWRRFLDAVTAMGYRLVVTEFDVRDRGLPADIGVRDRGVADFARAYLDLTLSYPQLSDILVWGMSDRYSWLNGFEPRPDGERTRGCPYDAALAPKPLRGAIEAAMAAAPPRTPRA